VIKDPDLKFTQGEGLAMDININLRISLDSGLPKYACPKCGSEEVRGDLDSYQVYRAEGQKLVYLRSEFTDPAVLALHCLDCNERIPLGELADIEIQ